MSWIEAASGFPLVRGLYYEGEPYRGKPTRVFAWVGEPEGIGASGQPTPGMVLVHGGGGTAYAEWAQMWAERGYTCIAMDLSGRDADGSPMSDGGPTHEEPQKFDDIADGLQCAWPYQAVANVMRATTLLASMEHVDETRLGVTGISWGGYLTCLVSALDDRLHAAAPVYGCGFLHHNSAWLNVFERMSPADRESWIAHFDPSQYLSHRRGPMLWVNGTNDFAYPLDSYQETYRLPPAERTLSVQVGLGHGHTPGWSRHEIELFINSVLRDGAPLAQLGVVQQDGDRLWSPCTSHVPLMSASLHYARHEGPWKDRTWHTEPATLCDGGVEATCPIDRPIVCFLTATDERGAITSAEHAVLA